MVAFDVPLSEVDAGRLTSYLRKLSGGQGNYHYQQDDVESMENAIKMRIGTVAVIQDKLNLGVYARQLIREGDVIGYYEGERFDANSEQRSTIYVMYLDQYLETDEEDTNEAIDASHIFNWARFMNHSEFGFNCQFSLNDDRIIVTAIKDITEGQQLLVHYGADYKFDAKVILHSTHNHLKPAGIVSSNKKHYIEYSPDNFEKLLADTADTLCTDNYGSVLVTTLCEELLKNSNLVIQDSTLIELPSYFKIDTMSFEEVIPLMLACYKGSIKNVKLLLGKDADPLRCSLMGGRNSLVFAILSNVQAERSKEILELLIKHVANNSNDDLVYQHLIFIEGKDADNMSLFDHICESELVVHIINEESTNSSLNFFKEKFLCGDFPNKYSQNIVDHLTCGDITINHVEFTDQSFLTIYQKLVDKIGDQNVNIASLNEEKLKENRYLVVKVAIDSEKNSKKYLKLLQDIDRKLDDESRLDMYTQVFTHCVAYITDNSDHENMNKANVVLSHFKNEILWKEKMSVFSYALQHVCFWHGRAYNSEKWNSSASLKYLKKQLLDMEYNFISDHLTLEVQAALKEIK